MESRKKKFKTKCIISLSLCACARVCACMCTRVFPEWFWQEQLDVTSQQEEFELTVHQTIERDEAEEQAFLWLLSHKPPFCLTHICIQKCKRSYTCQGLRKSIASLWFLKKFRDPQFTTNILAYALWYFSLWICIWVTISLSYNLDNCKMKQTKWSSYLTWNSAVHPHPTWKFSFNFHNIMILSSLLFLIAVLLNPSF